MFYPNIQEIFLNKMLLHQHREKEVFFFMFETYIFPSIRQHENTVCTNKEISKQGKSRFSNF